MKTTVSYGIGLAVCLLFALAACTSPHKFPTHQSTMSASALKAGSLAYQAFAREVADPKAENDFQKFASSPNNYDVLFLENKDAYYFAFRIRLYHGRPPLDGGITYKVDKSNESVSIAKFPQSASSS